MNLLKLSLTALALVTLLTISESSHGQRPSLDSGTLKITADVRGKKSQGSVVLLDVDADQKMLLPRNLFSCFARFKFI